MSLRKLIVGLAVASVAASVPSYAQEPGNAQRGKAYAEQLCSDCHRIGKERVPSGVRAAPSFTSVAKTKGMTAMALGVWLQTGHPTMPNIQLKPDTMDDIIAYVMSLRPAPTARAPE